MGRLTVTAAELLRKITAFHILALLTIGLCLLLLATQSANQTSKRLLAGAAVEKEILLSYPATSFRVAKEAGYFLALVDKPDGRYGAFYDSSGNEIWVKKISTSLHGGGLISNNAATILLNHDVDEEVFHTSVYDRTGTLLWERQDNNTYLVSPDGGSLVPSIVEKSVIILTGRNGKSIGINLPKGILPGYFLVRFVGNDRLLLIRRPVSKTRSAEEAILLSISPPNVLWRHELPTGVSVPDRHEGAILLHGPRVFLNGFRPGQTPCSIICLDMLTGNAIWTTDIPFVKDMIESFDGDFLVIPSVPFLGDSKLYLLSSETGRTLYTGTIKGHHLLVPTDGFFVDSMFVLTTFVGELQQTLILTVNKADGILEHGAWSDESFGPMVQGAERRLINLRREDHNARIEIVDPKEALK